MTGRHKLLPQVVPVPLYQSHLERGADSNRTREPPGYILTFLLWFIHSAPLTRLTGKCGRHILRAKPNNE